MENLEEVLNGEEAAEPETTEEATQEATGEQVESTPDTKDKETTGDESWSKTAYMDEKRKRQALEREVTELKTVKNEPKTEEKGDFWDNPDTVISQIETKHQSDLADLRVEMSQEIMRSKYDDYDEKELEFVDLTKKNPGLVEQLRVQSNPAKFIYDTVQQQVDIKDLGTAKTRIEELEAQLAKINGENDTKNAKRESITPSLSNQRNVSGGTQTVTDESLEDLFGR